MDNEKYNNYIAKIEERAEQKRARNLDGRVDAEFAYEALALSSGMGMFGQQDQSTNLLQFAVAQQILAKSYRNYNNEFKLGD